MWTIGCLALLFLATTLGGALRDAHDVVTDALASLATDETEA